MSENFFITNKDIVDYWSSEKERVSRIRKLLNLENEFKSYGPSNPLCCSQSSFDSHYIQMRLPLGF